MELGIDSLSVTPFVATLQKQTGLQLSPTLIFEHTTAEAVAQHLVQLEGGGCTRAPFGTLGAAEGNGPLEVKPLLGPGGLELFGQRVGSELYWTNPKKAVRAASDSMAASSCASVAPPL